MTSTADNAKRHQQRQQKLQQTVAGKVAAATDERGVLMVLTGNGKGKTTAAIGTVTRAVGHGKKAAVVQFIKGNWDCGERNLLAANGVQFDVMATGFTWDTQDKEADMAAAQVTWQQALLRLQDPTIDLVVLDELTYMLSYHYLAVDDVVAAIEQRPEHQHVIVTGRACHRKLTALADTVSEVKPIKHAFDAGIKAQIGFDY